MNGISIRRQYLTLLVAVCFSIAGPLSAEELLLYSGLPVSIPDSTILPPFAERVRPEEQKQIKFQREFFIDGERLSSLPGVTSDYGEIAVNAAEAIEISRKDVDPMGELRSLIVTAVQLLTSTGQVQPEIEFYLVSMLVNGSEEHRIVLMNRDVIAPKLKRLEE